MDESTSVTSVDGNLGRPSPSLGEGDCAMAVRAGIARHAASKILIRILVQARYSVGVSYLSFSKTFRYQEVRGRIAEPTSGRVGLNPRAGRPSEPGAFSAALRMHWDYALSLRNHPEQLRVQTNDPTLPTAPHGFQGLLAWVVALEHVRGKLQ